MNESDRDSDEPRSEPAKTDRRHSPDRLQGPTGRPRRPQQGPRRRPEESGRHRRGPRGGRLPRRRLRSRPPAVDPATLDGDPVRATFAGEVDLYDVATWEVRTRLDSLAVAVTNGLRAGRTVGLVAVALLLFLLQGGVVTLIVLQEPFLGVLAVSSILPALAVAGYLWYGDPTRREPLVTLSVTFLLSLLFAGFAGVVNTVLAPVFGALGALGAVAFFFLVVGPVEEFVKWLAIRVYAVRGDAFQTVVDGVVYGAVAGLGFAAIENLTYIVGVYLEADGTAGIGATEAATSVATQRLFVGPGHVIFSAWAGFYLGLARFNPENRGPIVIKGLLIAAFIHAVYNSTVSVLPEFVSPVVLFGFIVLYDGFWLALLYRKVRAYRDLYRSAFPDSPRGPRRR